MIWGSFVYNHSNWSKWFCNRFPARTPQVTLPIPERGLVFRIKSLVTADFYPGREGIGKGDLEWKANPQPADPSQVTGRGECFLGDKLHCPSLSLDQLESEVWYLLERRGGGAAALCRRLFLWLRMEDLLPAASSNQNSSLGSSLRSLAFSLSCLLCLCFTTYFRVICTLAAPRVARPPAARHGRAAGQKGGIFAGGAGGRSALGEQVRAWTPCTARLPPTGAGTQGRGPPTPPQAGCHLHALVPRETSHSQRGVATGSVSCAGLVGGCWLVLRAEGALGGWSRRCRKEHCDQTAMSAMAEGGVVPCECCWLSSPRTHEVGFPPVKSPLPSLLGDLLRDAT